MVHRAPGHDETLGDLRVLQPVSDEHKHLELSRGQVRGVLARGRTRPAGIPFAPIRRSRRTTPAASGRLQRLGRSRALERAAPPPLPRRGRVPSRTEARGAATPRPPRASRRPRAAAYGPETSLRRGVDARRAVANTRGASRRPSGRAAAASASTGAVTRSISLGFPSSHASSASAAARSTTA